MKKKLLLLISILLTIFISLGVTHYIYKTYFYESKIPITEEPQEPIINNNNPITEETINYYIKLIKEINKNENKNYLISPYSIEMALSMLRDGAEGETKKQITDLIGNRELNYFNSKKKINVANALFVNKKYKDNVLDSYYNIVKDKYKSDIIYDKFEGPKAVNDWVNKKTNKMIPSLLDDLDETDLLVLVNALAIDLKWEYSFSCNNTNKAIFFREDGSWYKVAMMRENYEKENVKYFKDDKSEGVIIPYKTYDDNDNRLEFVGILPVSNINSYIDNLTAERLESIDKIVQEIPEGNTLTVAIPKFQYDYEIEKFIDALQSLGIKNAFDEADLSKMLNISSHVSQVVHKTHIEVKEQGTKATAASGVVITKDASSEQEERQITIRFEKPFVYMIRDQKTKEILFFGVVYEPDEWNGKTCENEKS